VDLGKIKKMGLEPQDANKIACRCWWPDFPTKPSFDCCLPVTNKQGYHASNTSALPIARQQWWLRDLSSELHYT
jgi:hypothetical protein